MKIIIFVLFLIKFTSSYSILNRNSKLIDYNGKPLNIYSYVFDDDLSKYVLQDISKDAQLLRNRRQNHQRNYIRVIKMDSSNEDNLRRFSYELSDGTRREEKIRLIDQIDDNGEAIQTPSVSGTSQYVSKEGYVIQNKYTADKNGYVTKVLFGTYVLYKPDDLPVAHSPPKKGVGDGNLLCSLIGGGCL